MAETMQEIESKYELYVGVLQPISDDIKFSFYNGKHAQPYILVFADKKPRGEFTLVSKEKYSELDKDEARWLLAAKNTINAEYVKEHAEDFIDFLNAYCDNLEKEIEKYKQNNKE